MSPASEEPWIATTATITTCRFQTPGLGMLAFGFSTRERFLITFDYYAHGRLYSDEFQSPVAIPQNETIPLTYNPFDPQQNSRTHRAGSAPAKPPPIAAVGIAGSVVIAVIWLIAMRGCHS